MYFCNMKNKKFILVKPPDKPIKTFTTLTKACEEYGIVYDKVSRKKFPFWHEGHYFIKQIN